MNAARSRQKGRGHHLGLVLVCVLVLPLMIALGPWTLHATAAAPEGKFTVQEAYGKLPLHFEANQGQTASQVKFLSRGPGYMLFLTPTEAVLALKQAKGEDSLRATRHALREYDPTVLQMKIEGANPSPPATGLDPLPGIVNYFIGDDPAQWRTNVPTYAKVRYDGLYPGVDLIYYGTQRQLEYDFVVRPGADPSSIELSFQGADRLEVDAQGDLVLHTAAGAIRMRKPVIYQEVGGVRREISGGYVLMGGHHVGFQVAAYDASRPLIIDPVLSYSTYLGGSGFDDQGLGIAVDAAGNAYVTGFTDSTNFPTTAGAFQPTSGGSGAFVTKLDPTGAALVYSTYLGGSDIDRGFGIAVDAAGNAYVTGFTGSLDFPTTAGAFQVTIGGGGDAFVTQLNPTGAALVYSTYLSGSGADAGRGIAVDAAGNAYVTGETDSLDFPTTGGAFQPIFGGPDFDAFVTKLNPTGAALVYSTYLGGSDFDVTSGIAVDAAGNAYVTGETSSSDFPTTAGAFQPTRRGPSDAFVTKLTATGAALVYSTYLGGGNIDRGFGIAVDTAGNAYVTGVAFSTDFPTTAGAFQPTFGGGFGDVFVAKITDVPSDTTPPVTTALPSPMGNAAGWNSGDVMVTLSATDAASGVLQITYSASGAQVSASTTVPGETTSVLITAEGETTITFFAEDNASNQETPTTIIVRIDRTPPTITAPSNVTVGTGPGATLCNAAVSNATLGTATASDNSGIVMVSRSAVPAGNVFPVGATFVTYTATDSVGLMTSATQLATVNDTTAPVLSARPDVTVYATSPAGAAVTYTLPGATDNCPGVSTTSAPRSGSTFAIGATIVTVTATDAAGNRASKTFRVTVVGAAEQITALRTLVSSFVGLPNSIEKGLLAKLGDALAAINAGKERKACRLLDSFINQVRDQTGKKKKLTAAQAAQLIASATLTKAALGCR